MFRLYYIFNKTSKEDKRRQRSSKALLGHKDQKKEDKLWMRTTGGGHVDAYGMHARIEEHLQNYNDK